MHQLNFSDLFEYDGNETNISLAVEMQTELDMSVTAEVKLDTGSTYCVFKKEVGENLGIDVLAGDPLPISGATGGITAYGHEVSMKFGDYEWTCVAYFADEEIKRSVLGRIGFLDRFKIGLIDYEQKFFFSFYGQGEEDEGT